LHIAFGVRVRNGILIGWLIREIRTEGGFVADRRAFGLGLGREDVEGGEGGLMWRFDIGEIVDQIHMTDTFSDYSI